MNNNTETFKEKAVIITGASSGIGEQMAYQLAAQGAWLVLAARNEEKLNSVAAECRQFGGRALVVRTDVTKEDQCQNLVERTVKEYGRLDVLILCAGIGMWARISEIQKINPQFREIMEVNFWGSAYCSQCALPYLKKSQGQIVVVCSLAGKTGVPKMGYYCASKHAESGYFETLDFEGEVDVTIVYPGFVATDMHKRILGPEGTPLGKNPIKDKMMPAEECAQKILRAAGKRKHKLIMTWKGRVGLWLQVICPPIVKWLAQRVTR